MTDREHDRDTEDVHGSKQHDPMHQGSTHQGSMKQGAEMRCPMCGVEFRSQTELEQHKKQAHPTK